MKRLRFHSELRQLAASALLAVAMSAPADTQATGASARPQRIVSLNLCTDELLMQMVEPERIASITFLSRATGAGPPDLQPLISRLHANRGLAEEVLMLKPDLVLVGAYSSRQTTELLTKLGFNIVAFTPESDLDDVRDNIRRMGDAVGEPERASQMIEDFDERLANLAARLPPDGQDDEPPVYADIGVNNWMAGKGTLTASIVRAGGFRTLGEAAGFEGYRNIPLEQLVRASPALVSTPTQWTSPPSLSTDALRHPALKSLAQRAHRIQIPDRLFACGSPYSLDAVEILVEARLAIAAPKTGQSPR